MTESVNKFIPVFAGLLLILFILCGLHWIVDVCNCVFSGSVKRDIDSDSSEFL